MIVHERRASAVLYRLLVASADRRPFLLPANVCPVVPRTFLTAGRPVELVDIAADTLALDGAACLDQVRRRAGELGGVLFVHPFGAETDIAPLFGELRQAQSDLSLIDDRCLAPPEPERPPVPDADATLYSTGYAKVVDLGRGGFAHLADGVAYRRDLTSLASLTPVDPADADWLDLAPPEESWEAYREELAAALPAAAAHRRRLNAIYRAGLPAEIRLGDRFDRWRHQIVVPESEALVAELFARGLFASRHYPSLGGEVAPGSFPVADRLAARIVNLFNDRYYDESQAEETVAVVVDHLARYGREA
jgi:dTDP-4-amino-4,6-dideoxygalactose transaminase